MPAWLSFLLPLAISLVERYGIPLVEKKWPFLVPILNEVIAVLGGLPPGPSLTSAANHFNTLQSSVASVPTLKTE